MSLSIAIKNATLSIMARYVECHLCRVSQLSLYSDCILNVIMMYVILLNVIMLYVIFLNVIMLNVIMLNVIMLNVIMLNVIMLNVVMLNVILLNVMAPKKRVW